MVAPGELATGHLGELTRVVPFELVDCLVDDARARERRLRLLPSRTGVYFLLAMCLFPRAGYLAVWGKLTAALDGLGLDAPLAKALRPAAAGRGRAGQSAVRDPRRAAGPAPDPRDHGRRVPDRVVRRLQVGQGPGHAREPGLAREDERLARRRRLPGHPVHGPGRDRDPHPPRGRVRGTATSELDWGRRLLHLLDETMLVLMDRGFDAGDFLAEVDGTGARFLVRLNASRRPPVLPHLPDGSFTSVIGGVKVRIIAAEVHRHLPRPGQLRRLVPPGTTLLDDRAFPAARLMALYHER
jgi:hypothetical protein